jgi:hypothetical protein
VARDARHKDRTTFLLLRRGTIRSSKSMLENLCFVLLYIQKDEDGGGGTRKFVDWPGAVLK